MHKQEIFDHVTNHLLSMKDQSRKKEIVDAFSSCAYRTPEGNMCAAGVLFAQMQKDKGFSDEFLESLYDHQGSYTDMLLVFGKNKFPDWADAYSDLINRLQQAHDDADHWGAYGFNYDGMLELKEICAEDNLKWNFQTQLFQKEKESLIQN